MLCVTHGLDAIAAPWAYKHPQVILELHQLLPVTTVKAIAAISAEQRKASAEAAVERLDLLTSRIFHGFAAMTGGNDKKKPWKVKAYVNASKCPLRIRILGPLGSIDERKQVTTTLAPGEAIITCAVHVKGEEPGKLTFPQGVKTQPQSALKALLHLGLCIHDAREMQAATPDPIVATTLRKALRSEESSPEDQRLNAAFVDLDDDSFTRVRAILGLHGEEEETVMAMSTNKRRRLRELFHLLASSNATLQELAQSAVAEQGGETEEEHELPRPAPVFPSLAASEKCVCGIYEGGKMVEFGEESGKGKKLLF